MTVMAKKKTEEKNFRRLYGFVWLARMKPVLREQVVKFVTGKISEPLWLKNHEWRDRVRMNRSVYTEAVKNKRTLRSVGHEFDMSYQSVKNLVRVYSNPEMLNFSSTGRRDFRDLARRVITLEVIEKFDRGELSLGEVAKMISEKASTEHAAYWIKIMRRELESYK